MEDITKINEVRYKYEYKLSNSSGELSVNDSAVVLLNIVDNLFDPFIEGSITIANPFNYLEKDFVLRGDGTDKILITLYPETTPKEKIEVKGIIVSEQNSIDDTSPALNQKTYIFIDEDEGMLKEEFVYNIAGKGKIGDMIKDLLTMYKLKVDEENFEPGSFTIDNITELISPTVNFRCLDFLFYLLRYYYYKDGDLCVNGFLKKEKGKYQLKILSKDYFAKNKDITVEAFSSGEITNTPKPNKNNTGDSDINTNLYANNVTSIGVTTPATSITNTFFMNSIVSGYDHILGCSVMKEVRITDVRSKWQKKFVDVFKSVGGKVKKHLLLKENKIKGQFKTYRLPFSIEDSANIVEAEIVSNLTFYNQQLNLNVIGNTRRKSGVFVDINKLKETDTGGDQKLIGRWFVTAVRHVKILNTYRNEINCVKTYAGPTFKDTDV